MLTHQDVSNLAGVIHTLKSRLADAFARRGIGYPPMQLKVLRMVSRIDACNAQCVAQTLDRDKAQVTRLLQELVNDGVLERIPNPVDKRSQLLHLTEEGSVLYQQMLDAEQEVLRELAGMLSSEDQQAFSELMARMNAALNPVCTGL